MTDPTPMRFGIVGTRRGSSLLKVLTHLPGACVAAVCDIRVELAEQVAEALGLPKAYGSYPEMLDSGDVDAVYVATPPMVHAEQSMEALGRGIHVLSEVPAVHTLEEAPQLLRAAEDSDAVYRIAENMNYATPLRQVVAMAREGLLGDISYCYGNYLHELRDRWKDEDGRPTWRGTYPGSIQYCTHELGPILEILDDRVAGVSASVPGQEPSDDLKPMFLTNVAVYHTRKGRLIVQRTDFQNAGPHSHHRFVIQGSRGVVEVVHGREKVGRYFVESEKDAGWQDLSLAPAPFSAPDESRLPEWAASGGHGTLEYYMILDFLRAVDGKSKQGTCDIRRALDMSLPGIIAVQSIHQSGAKLPVPAL